MEMINSENEVFVNNALIIHEEDYDNCGEFDLVETRAAIEESAKEHNHNDTHHHDSTGAGKSICGGVGID